MNKIPFVASSAVGLEPYLDIFKPILRSAASGDGHTLLLTGEAGMGKSRTAAEFMKLAEHEGCAVLQASCFELDRELAWVPILDLFRTSRDNFEGDQVQKYLTPSLLNWARSLFDPDGADTQQTPASAPMTEHEKRSLLRDQVQFLTGLSTVKPLLLVLEDLHWSDNSTLQFVHYLARSIQTERVLLLLTYRADEMESSLMHLLAELDRERLVFEIALRRLNRSQTDTMLGGLLGLKKPVPTPFLESVYDLTGGNPFSVEEVVRAMMPRGKFGRSISPSGRQHGAPFGGPPEVDLMQVHLERLPVPRSIEDTVERRLGQISTEAVDLLRTASVAGRTFSFDLLLELTRYTEQELLRLLKQGIEARLIHEASSDRFAFVNPLTRHAIYSTLLSRERMSTHRRVAEALERMHSDELSYYLDDLAYHYYEGEVWDRALAYSEQAGENAHAVSKPRDSINHFTRALDASQRLGFAPASRLYRLRGLAYDRLGQIKLGRTDQKTAFEIARAAHDTREEWEALTALGDMHMGRDYYASLDYYNESLALAREMDKEDLVARSLNAIAACQRVAEQPTQAMDNHRQAHEIFSKLRDRRGLSRTMAMIGETLYTAGDMRRSAQHFLQSLEICYQMDDARGLLGSLPVLMAFNEPSYMHSVSSGGHQRIMSEHLDEQALLSAAQEMQSRLGEGYTLCMQAQCAGFKGQYSRALAMASSAMRIMREWEHEEGLALAYCTLGAIKLDLLLVDEAHKELETAIEFARRAGSHGWATYSAAFLLAACTHQNDLKRASEIVEQFANGNHRPETLGQRLVLFARAELALAVGDTEVALRFSDLLMTTPEGSRGEASSPRLLKLRGECLALLGRQAEAEALSEAAKATSEAEGSKSLLWRIHAAQGTLLQARGMNKQASAEFAASFAIVDELAGAIQDSAMRDRFQERVGSLYPQLRKSSVKLMISQEFEGLTSRELEVAALIFRGMSNSEIASELVVGRRTVETHISNMLTKLGFSSRRQVADWVDRHGAVQYQGR